MRITSALRPGARAAAVVEACALASAAFNSLAVPFRYSFIGDSCLGVSGWATAYLILDCLLIISTLLRLRDHFRHSAASSRTSLRWLQQLAWHLVAVACCLPWDFLFAHGSSSGSGSSSSTQPAAGAAAYCYSYRQLTRCYFAGRLVRALTVATNHAFPALGEQRATASFVQLVLHSLLPLHWYACLLYGLPRLMGAAEAAEAWVADSNVDASPLWARYVRSFDRGLLIVLGEGGHGETDVEILVSTLGLLFGTGLLAYFTSRIVEILTSTNHFEQMTRQKIGRVISFMNAANLPPELVRRCTDHLQHFMLSTSLTADTKDLLRELSAPLRDEVALASRKALVVAMLTTSKWFQGDKKPSDFFIKMLVQRLDPAVFSPGDYLIVEGEVSRGAGSREQGPWSKERLSHTPRPSAAFLRPLTLLRPRGRVLRALIVCPLALRGT